MASELTKIADLINPQVMSDMISAKVPKAIIVSKFAKVDTTLQGTAGDTITVPQYAYIGDAADIAEGLECETVKLTTSTTSAKVKKAMKAVDITDEAALSGYGNPVGEATNQLSKAIASKIDADSMTALLGAQLHYEGSAAQIAYAGVVDAVDLFEEEFNSEKVMFVHPKQVTKLRKDTDFISADKYDNKVMMTGEIGMVANTRVLPSKRVVEFATHYKFDAAGTAITELTLATVQATLPTAKVGDKVTEVAVACYFNPIVKLEQDAESEDEAAAITIYMKRDVNVETERKSLARKTSISADEMYTVALSNTAKVVLAKIKK